MSGLQVRLARIADIEQIAEVHLASVSVGYAGIFPAGSARPTLTELATEWRRFLETPDTETFLATIAGALIGSAIARPDPDDAAFGQLYRLYVAPEHWGHGAGAQLHDYVLARLAGRGFREARLWVLEANVRARSMYERRGWAVDGGRKPGPAGVPELRYRRELTRKATEGAPAGQM